MADVQPFDPGDLSNLQTGFDVDPSSLSSGGGGGISSLLSNGNFFSDIGGAVSDLFGAAGDKAEATAYGKAATIATENEEIAAQSTAIQQAQASRSIYQNLGAQNAAAEGNGLVAGGGSAGDIYRNSVYQGALNKQLIGRQGLITENNYAAEAEAYKGMQSAANAASSGGIFGAIIKGVAAFL